MKITIIGGGNMGGAIARGLATSDGYSPENITIIDPVESKLTEFKKFNASLNTTADDFSSLSTADIIIIAVKPWDVERILTQNRDKMNNPTQIIISVAASLSLKQLDGWLAGGVTVGGLTVAKTGGGRALFCAIPNTAIELKQSMTFICSLNTTSEQEQIVLALFNELGKAELISEQLLPAATALCSCGIAFAFRYIRAAMEGGVELGFYPNQAKESVVQTLRGAIELLEQHGTHPEAEIDRVTTAGGITIRGLNEMEHAGFTSAVIRGLKATM